MLTRLAIENPGTAGKFKLAAGLVYKKHLIATGVNSYKTHPIMMNKSYREEQVFLHAEVECLIRASKLLTPSQMGDSLLVVVRVKRGPCGGWVYGNACPCQGCAAVISEFGIKRVEYTNDTNV